jgi:ketosteroid isomerase-like protein
MHTNLTEELAIRGQRAAFNRALASGDLAGVAAVLADKAMLIAGTDSAVLSGRKAQLAVWKRDFASADRVIYERMPERIVVSPVAPIAMEYGRWHGGSKAMPEDFAAGSYAAKWRCFGGTWQIEAETFLTEACGGAFC